MLEIFRNIEYLPRTILVLMLYFLFMKKLSCLGKHAKSVVLFTFIGKASSPGWSA